MNLLNLIEDSNTGYDNLRALMQAVQNSQDALLTIGGEPVTLTYPEARFMFGKYKAFNQAGRQEEFLNVLGDPVKFDQHMKQLRQLIDKQKNFQGSVPGQRSVTGDVPPGINELSSDLLQKSAQVAKDKSDWAMDPKIHDALGGGYMNPVAKHYDSLSQKFSNRAVKVGQRDAVKKIASPAVMRKIGMAEGVPLGYSTDPAQAKWYHEGRKAYKGGTTGNTIQDIAKKHGCPSEWIDAFHAGYEDQQGWGKEEPALEEIAMPNSQRPTSQTAGKINWERMIKDYMENKPYSEFEFSGDRPLTLYRSQVYAILKDFGRMKPQQKVGIILNTFGDKIAMVDYIDKLRAKGMMPKKVPAYVSPDVEPVPAGQMSFPGMGTPRIKEAEAQKKNSEQTSLDGNTARSPKVQRAFQLARARQSAAGSDIEAFVKDELEKSEQAQTQLDQLQAENDRQDQQIQQLAAKVRQQDQEISQPEPTAVKTEPAKEKPKAAEPEKKAKPGKKATEPRAAEKPAEPKQQRDGPRAEPAPAKAEKPPKVDQPKPDDTEIQRPRPEPVEVPANVLQFPTTAQRKKNKKAAAAQVDPMAAAMQGVDMSDIGRAVGMNESNDELHIGDPVIIRGNIEHSGKTGDVAEFGRDKHFVIVDLYNFGKHAFHASNVEYNEYADQEDYIDENQRMDRFNIAQPAPGGTNKQREEFLNARDRLFRQMQSASPGEKEAIRLKIAELEGRAQSQGIRIRENNLDEFVTPQAVAQDPSLEREKDVNVVVFGRIPQDFHAEQLVDALEELLPAEYPPGGDWKHQDQSQHGPAPRKMFEVLKQGGAVVTTKPLSIAKKLVSAFNGYGIKARIDASGITETDELNRSGYNAIKTVGDWAEKMRVMRELQKDIALMSDPEAKAAVQQRIGDLLKVGIKQGYVKEALNDKAMSVLRSLQQPAQTAPAAIDLNVPEPAMDLATVRKRIAQLDELIRMKEQIDKLFVRAQNARGGIYPGLQSDIEDEELYGVPQSDKEYQTLKDKYAKDLLALQKFIAMKKAVYREGQEIIGESSALVRLKRARQALSQQGLNEYAPGQGGGGSGNYFQALASAWYNGAFNTGSLDKGIKSKVDVERLLNRGIIGPDGVTRKYAIDYNSDFDGVVISSDDYYEHSDYNDQGQEVDSRTGQKWGPNDYMEFSDDDLSEGINEFAPGAGGSDDGDEDPYKYPKPESYRRSIDFFGRFEADHFDREDFDEATGVFKGYWGTTQIAYFKFNDPARTDSDDPGMGWYYEPQNEGVVESLADEFMKMAKDMGMNPRLRGTPDEERARTAAMLKQRAADRANAPKPAPVSDEERANLEARLKELEAKFDPDFEYSDDYSFWSKQNDIKKNINSIKQRLSQGIAEAQTDYQRRRQRERDVDAGKPVSRQPKNPQSDYARMRAKQKRDQELGEDQLDEKQDACYNKVKSRYKVWPSAYASGALVQCRKKGADNWGEGGKKK